MRARSGPLPAPAFALLALVGAWIGHAVEYVRVAPRVGFADALTGPLHRAYIVPLGIALGALLAVGSARWLRLWWALGRRLDAARRQLFGAWRNKTTTAGTAHVNLSAGRRLGALAGALAVAQLGVYLVQENIEAAVARQAPPGMSAITGIHWGAPLVQLGVAVLIAAAVTILGHLVRWRGTAIARLQTLVRMLLGRPVSSPVPTRRVAAATPRERLGAQLWRRPPPALLPTY